MANLLARLTMANVPGARTGRLFGLGSDEKEGTAQANDLSPIFIHPKAISFPVAVGLVKGAWEAAKSSPISWLHSPWFPLGACIAIGLLIAVSNLLELKAKPLAWVIGLIVGGLNSLVVFGAVMGIPGSQP